nr:MAG TPA: hypothetical protein [Caudoviricetes sp.]
MILLCANPADGWTAKVNNQCNQSQRQNDAQPNNNHGTRVKPAFIDPLHLLCVRQFRASAAIFWVLFARYFNIKIGVQIDAARTANRSDSVDRRVLGISAKILRNRIQSQACFVCNMLVRNVCGVFCVTANLPQLFSQNAFPHIFLLDKTCADVREKWTLWLDMPIWNGICWNYR